MSNLITVEDLLTGLKDHNISFGKGDPYNRLRYYTKLGWIPHMIRKRDSKGRVKGHYPKDTLERIVLIENLKKDQYGNSEIDKKIAELNQTKTDIKKLKFLEIVKILLASKEVRQNVLNVAIVLTLIIVITNETGLIKLGRKTKAEALPLPEVFVPTTTVERLTPIVKSGTGMIPQGQSEIFINAPEVKTSDLVHITFVNDYSPALRYWIKDIQAGKGFTVKMDTKVLRNSTFNWWISQN